MTTDSSRGSRNFVGPQPSASARAGDYRPAATPGHTSRHDVDRTTLPDPLAPVLEAEVGYVKKRREYYGLADDDTTSVSEDLIGLALSGGGIRSATFSLGILQALARNDVLRRVDYLSTVSGGGYIGSALTWFTRQRVDEGRQTAGKTDVRGQGGVAQGRHEEAGFDCSSAHFPFGSDDPRPGSERSDSAAQLRRLAYLRDKGFYLTPGAGISAVSLLGAVLRGTILNLLVWLPLFTLMFCLAFAVGERIEQSAPGLSSGVLSQLVEPVTPELICPEAVAGDDRKAKVCQALTGVKTTPDSRQLVYEKLSSIALYRSYAQDTGRFGLFALALYAVVAIGGLLFLLLVVFSLLTRASRGADETTRKKWYTWRRKVTKDASNGILILLSLAGLGVLPILAAILHNGFLAIGPLAATAGIVIAMKDFLKPKSGAPSGSSSLTAVIGAALFLFGMTIICFYLALYVHSLVSSNAFIVLLFLVAITAGVFFYLSRPWTGLTILAVYAAMLFFQGLEVSDGVVVAVVALALITGYCVNLNYISIHRFYRDRLMEAFLPNDFCDREADPEMATGADVAYLDGFSQQDQPRAPYHLVNTNVVLVNSKDSTYSARGGDNFILSPFYCGSNATGWNRTAEYMSGRMTLPTAVAISGAAANPNTGVGGAGLTRNLVVSLVMSLLNLRLGYWATRPRDLSVGKPPGAPNHLMPGMYSFGNLFRPFGKGFNEHRKFVQLSDGGHFENTALYELIRRKVKIAIVCDGGADEHFSFSDMQTTVRRVHEDFGAEIQTLRSSSPDHLVPLPDDGGQDRRDPDGGPLRYPRGRGFSERGHMFAKITYSDNTSGLLIYLKTALVNTVSFRVKGYAAVNPKFPDEPTSDQFFDNVQFDSYRELGYTIAQDMLHSDVPEELNCAYAPGERMLKLLKENPEFTFY